MIGASMSGWLNSCVGWWGDRCSRCVVGYGRVGGWLFGGWLIRWWVAARLSIYLTECMSLCFYASSCVLYA